MLLPPIQRSPHLPCLLSSPRYVVAKDPASNAVFVSREYHSSQKSRRQFWVGHFSFLAPLSPTDLLCMPGLRCKVREGAAGDGRAPAASILARGGSGHVSLCRNNTVACRSDLWCMEHLTRHATSALPTSQLSTLTAMMFPAVTLTPGLLWNPLCGPHMVNHLFSHRSFSFS